MRLIGGVANLFIGLCCLLIFATCGSSESSAPTQGIAGQVQAIHGTVIASRGKGSSRPLSAGDVVYVDDTIRTSIESGAVILIEHNNATWNLGANLEKRVNESIVWTSTRKSGGLLVRVDTIVTAAAGRSSVGEAAESIETLEKPESMAGADEAVPAPVDSPTAPASVDVGRAIKRKPVKNVKTESRTSRRRNTSTTKDRGGNSQNGTTAKVFDRSDSTVSGLLGTGSDNPPSPKKKRAVEDEQESANTASSPAPMSLSAQIKGIAKTCQKKHLGHGTLTIQLTAKNGTLTKIEFAGDRSLNATKKCVENRVRTMTLSRSLDVSITF